MHMTYTDLTESFMLNALVYCTIPASDNVLWKGLLYTQLLQIFDRAWRTDGRTDNRNKDRGRQKQKDDVNQRSFGRFSSLVCFSQATVETRWIENDVLLAIRQWEGVGGIKVRKCLCGLNNFRYCPKTNGRRRFSCCKIQSIVFKSG